MQNLHICKICVYANLGHVYTALYSKTGVYRGMHYSLNFALKHKVLVLVRSVLTYQLFMLVSTCTKNLCFEQNMKINSPKIQLKIVIFTTVKKRCILYGRVFVMARQRRLLQNNNPLDGCFISIFPHVRFVYSGPDDLNLRSTCFDQHRLSSSSLR